MVRSWRELRDARRKGWRDGRAGVPPLEDEAIPFDLREILARCEERVHRLVQRWRRQDLALEVDAGDAEQQAVAANARLADAEMQRDGAVAIDELLKVEEEQRLARLQARLEELPTAEPPPFEIAEPEPSATLSLVPPIAGASAPKPEPPKPMPPALGVEDPAEDARARGIGAVPYWTLIALIVVGEIPLNAFAFRLFHESDLLTYLMTVTIAVGLVAFAHVLGLMLARPEPSRLERALTIVLIVVPLGAISVISLVRYGYLVDVGGDAGVGPLLGTLAFGSMNLLVFGAAAGLSYLHHDPRTLASRRAAERERLRDERRRAKAERERAGRERRVLDEALERDARNRRRLVEEERERRRAELEVEADRRRDELAARRDEALGRREQILWAMWPIHDAARERATRISELHRAVDDARTELGDAERRIQGIALRRRALWDATNGEIREVRAGRDRLAFAYCSANVRARRGHGRPRCLEDLPRLEVPADFEAAMAEVS